MVKTMLYCSEQIAIPVTFPNILKTYAKAAIRTQPYDLLRWSAAYFRCLANEVPPPVKQRLEKDCQHGSITKGYIKVLLDQLGKGYFVSRRQLQKRWAALCLPEEELLKYLSICRMLNWPQIHWLKLLTVMVGSLNETFSGTMNMLCELLTDDVEGGRSRIPVWMFRVCYTFVADLDCSEEQTFVNGRKKLLNGELEEERQMEKVPQVISTTSLRQAIFDECQHRYNTGLKCHPQEDLEFEKSVEKCSPRGSLSSSSVSSGFEFAGALRDPKVVLQKCHDFDSLILLLRESQGAVLHDYEGPFKVTQKNIEHSKRRELEVFENRQRLAETVEANAEKFLFQEKVNMLREVGPPWSWLNQFTGDNCMDKSFNFIEEHSIFSDETPPESSDESFDFVKEKPIVGTYQTETSDESSSDNVSALLIEKDDEKKQKSQDPGEIIRSFMEEAERNGKFDIRDSSSVTYFLCSNETNVLLKDSTPPEVTVDINNIVEMLQNANRLGIKFETVKDMMDYINGMKEKEELYLPPPKKPHSEKSVEIGESKEEFGEESAFMEEGGLEDGEESEMTITKKDDEENESEELARTSSVEKVKIIEDLGAKQRDKRTEDAEVEDQEDEEESVTKEKNVKYDDRPEEKSIHDDDEEDDTTKKDERVSKKVSQKRDTVDEDKQEDIDNIAIDEIRDDEKIPMMEIFEETGTLPEGTKAEGEESCSILGLMDKGEEEDEMGAEEEQSLISPSGTVSGLGDISDASSLYKFSEKSEEMKKRKPPMYTCPHSESSDSICSAREGFVCTVPAYPGIGGPISKKTVQDVLTYLKMRSRCQKGLIMPRNFKEEKCPRMFDNCKLSN